MHVLLRKHIMILYGNYLKNLSQRFVSFSLKNILLRYLTKSKNYWPRMIFLQKIMKNNCHFYITVSVGKYSDLQIPCSVFSSSECMCLLYHQEKIFPTVPMSKPGTLKQTQTNQKTTTKKTQTQKREADLKVTPALCSSVCIRKIKTRNIYYRNGKLDSPTYVVLIPATRKTAGF